MPDQGQAVRREGPTEAMDERVTVDPFDPIALEARLVEARARRAVALAQRKSDPKVPPRPQEVLPASTSQLAYAPLRFPQPARPDMAGALVPPRRDLQIPEPVPSQERETAVKRPLQLPELAGSGPTGIPHVLTQTEPDGPAPAPTGLALLRRRELVLAPRPRPRPTSRTASGPATPAAEAPLPLVAVPARPVPRKVVKADAAPRRLLLAAAALVAGPAVIAGSVLIAPADLRQDLADMIAPARQTALITSAPVSEEPATPTPFAPSQAAQPGAAATLQPSIETDAPRWLPAAPFAPGAETAPQGTASAHGSHPQIQPGSTAPEAASPAASTPPVHPTAEAPTAPGMLAALTPGAPDTLPPAGIRAPTLRPAAAPEPGRTEAAPAAPLVPPAPAAPTEAAQTAALAQPSPEAAPLPAAFAPAPELIPEIVPEPASAAIAGRITLHVPQSASADAEAAATALEGQSADAPVLVPVGFSISQTNVRYYHAGDRLAAERIAGLLGEAAGAAIPARDFTDFRPSPPEGLVEVWMAGEAATVATAPPPPVTTPPSSPPVSPPPVSSRTLPSALVSAPPASPPSTIAERAAQIETARALRLQQQVERMLADQVRRLEQQ